MTGVRPGFGGEVAGFYHKYRHGYPSAVIDAVADAFGLNDQDLVVDLGCGTGQLTLPMAERVCAVVGLDPEPDMLLRARRAARDLDVLNVSWMIGADTDIPALGSLLRDRSVGAVTIGQALHWMEHDILFQAVNPLVRAGGGVAVLTNGTPLWLQETEWSRVGLTGSNDVAVQLMTHQVPPDVGHRNRRRDTGFFRQISSARS